MGNLGPHYCLISSAALFKSHLYVILFKCFHLDSGKYWHGKVGRIFPSPSGEILGRIAMEMKQNGQLYEMSQSSRSTGLRKLSKVHELKERHNSFRRHLPRQMQVSSVDLGMGTEPILQRGETTTSIGRIKPELYKQKSVDSEDDRKEDVKTCGKLNFTLQYDYENELLVVKIIKALDLPAKDFMGTSDPYVKMYLLPDRKKKFQTRVHRKTLNPLFDETFQFPVAYDQLSNRKLHFSVYDFDRFSRHDMIGEVIFDNLFEASDLSREATVWKDIHCATTVNLMYSFSYLETVCSSMSNCCFLTCMQISEESVLDRDRGYLKNKKTVKIEIAPSVVHSYLRLEVQHRSYWTEIKVLAGLCSFLEAVFIRRHKNLIIVIACVPGSSTGKESACNAGSPSWIPGSGRSPGDGIGYHSSMLGLPWWLRQQRMQCGRPGFNPQVGKIP
ncbi:hypothetical protein FD754_016151 [Muntiacus muntjak]|uniref:C2 domain-containing protein n=1 Tax=Muntiacus muntjak TaxID=9888 RepID=A0A5N3VQ85_MUNMU|nr:hypothetical protein FD754_016151 [Muntiacus muntjak]